MPTYIYTDDFRHDLMVTHGMQDTPQVICEICGAVMRRKPTAPNVVWGGLPPHLEHLRPKVAQEMIDGAPRRRDEYAAGKEQHEIIQRDYERQVNSGRT